MRGPRIEKGKRLGDTVRHGFGLYRNWRKVCPPRTDDNFMILFTASAHEPIIPTN
jgi:hypothetical protein